MRAKITKWGNSAAVRIPKAALQEAGFAEGDQVDLSVRNGVVELRSPRRRYTVEELFAEAEKLGPLEPPPTVDWGPDVGAEILPDDEYSRGEITLDDLLGKEDDPEQR